MGPNSVAQIAQTHGFVIVTCYSIWPKEKTSAIDRFKHPQQFLTVFLFIHTRPYLPPSLFQDSLHFSSSLLSLPMAILRCCFFIILFILGFAKSQPFTHPINHTDLQAAIGDMRAKSYYGFAMLLQMLNGTTAQPIRDFTFLMPDDKQLSSSSISVDEVGEFLLKHAIPMPLHFNDLSHFPTGTLVPSGNSSKMIRIYNRGKRDFFVNNAKIVSANVCLNSVIKCHGVDAIIDYDN
ncbi:hypothetical protein VNO80_29167 [Phaseolus coccineus]|uniref:FAS1 domain-containing protein n=1 Tax=Phaseolus coccineus TaxID=3886 RepID=A0AAN9LAX9_PHACN